MNLWFPQAKNILGKAVRRDPYMSWSQIAWRATNSLQLIWNEGYSHPEIAAQLGNYSGLINSRSSAKQSGFKGISNQKRIESCVLNSSENMDKDAQLPGRGWVRKDLIWDQIQKEQPRKRPVFLVALPACSPVSWNSLFVLSKGLKMKSCDTLPIIRSVNNTFRPPR